MNKAVIFAVLSLMLYFPIKAQKPDTKRESIFKDSLTTFRKIEKIAKKRRFTNELFYSIFRLPPLSKTLRGNVKKQNQDLYAAAENKIIRNIIIVTLDPFGTDIEDTASKANTYAGKFGNFIHIKTNKFAIRNRILIKENEKADKIDLYESERIIRSSDFISDVSLRVDTNYKSKDSVDIIIRTQDRWSIYGSAQGGGNYQVKATDKNIAGSGQRLEASLFKAQLFDSTSLNYRFSYFAPYIRHSFITAGVVFNRERGNEYLGGTLNRTFFSPLTKWAGGVDIFNYSLLADLTSIDSVSTQLINIRYFTTDAWAGYAIPTKGSSYQNRTTKFVVSARFYNKNYQNAPSFEYDPVYNQQNETNWLTSFGFTQRGYYKDKYIYKYGVTEDVPIGGLISATFGYQNRPIGERYYLGFKSSYGVGFRGGNASIYYEMGTYRTLKGKNEQGTINMGVQGFTNLVVLPYRILYRQFFSTDFSIGFNRTIYDRLTINNAKGLRGFNPLEVVGSNRMIVSTSAIFYLPWQMLGFRWAPIIYLGFGMIGDEKVSFIKDNIFPLVGLGLQIRNEYLIFSSFTLSLGYYPYIPSMGTHIFKVNPFSNNDFQFRNFEIGKPTILTY